MRVGLGRPSRAGPGAFCSGRGRAFRLIHSEPAAGGAEREGVSRAHDTRQLGCACVVGARRGGPGFAQAQPRPAPDARGSTSGARHRATAFEIPVAVCSPTTELKIGSSWLQNQGKICRPIIDIDILSDRQRRRKERGSLG